MSQEDFADRQIGIHQVLERLEVAVTVPEGYSSGSPASLSRVGPKDIVVLAIGTKDDAALDLLQDAGGERQVEWVVDDNAQEGLLPAAEDCFLLREQLEMGEQLRGLGSAYPEDEADVEVVVDQFSGGLPGVVAEYCLHGPEDVEVHSVLSQY